MKSQPYKRCAYSTINSYCTHIRVKNRECATLNGKTKWKMVRTMKRVKCPFKDKTKCVWFKGCGVYTWRKWSDPSLLQNARKGLNSSVQ